MSEKNRQNDSASTIVEAEKSPKISVIVPVYKVEKYLPECIESVLAQTFADFELILVDDGSPDNSGKICDAYAKKDSRIRVFHKENGGVSSARNLGIRNARGKWIALLDGDDTWLSAHLDNFAKAMVIHPSVLVFYTGYTNSKEKNFSPICSDFSFVVRDYWAMALKGAAIWTSCVCFNLSVFKTMPMFRMDLTHGEDLDVWRRFSKKFSIVMIPEKTAVYRIGSMNSAVAQIALPEKTIIWELDISKIEDSKEKLYFKRIYYGFLFSYIPSQIRFFFAMVMKKRGFGMWGFGWFWVKNNMRRLCRYFSCLFSI